MAPTFQDMRVTVMGLGRHGGGLAAASYLADCGARVTVTDLADEEVLADSVSQLANVNIERLCLGRHEEEDFRQADMVVVNPAVRPGNSFVEIARDNDATITTEIDLFLRACPASVIGVTGSNGKSTTAAMIAEILQAAGRRCWLGGNLGGSLLGELEQITADDWVVLELSSFQLARLREDTPAVQIAVVTGCTPNHLDWHENFAEYRDAKRRLLTLHESGSSQPCRVVLNTDDAEVTSWCCDFRARLETLVSDATIPDLSVPGRHNRQNARLAATAARAAQCDEQSIRQGLTNFRGLPHRLEVVANERGRMFINDSQSTTPESTIAALATMKGRAWLLAGGVTKTSPAEPNRSSAGHEIQTLEFSTLGDQIVQHTTGACFFGTAGPDLLRATRKSLLPADAATHCHPMQPAGNYQVTETLAEAMKWCWERSKPGDVLLLSPGCASFNQFRDCEHRAEVFTQLAGAIGSAPISSSEPQVEPETKTNLLASG